jgi:hypothetical protein
MASEAAARPAHEASVAPEMSQMSLNSEGRHWASNVAKKLQPSRSKSDSDFVKVSEYKVSPYLNKI